MFGQSRQFRNYLQDNWQDMYRIAYAWCNDNSLACDLVQETITRCLKNSEKFSNSEDLRIWLFKVMKNCWRDHLRKQKPTVDICETELQDASNIENEHYKYQLIEHTRRAFQLLSIEHREILSLIVLEGLGYEAVAKILDIPTGTVMSRVSRARSSLKKHLEEIDNFSDMSASVLWRIK